MITEQLSPQAQATTSPLPTEGVGGIVIGGDFQGLGIVRSLGRLGAPVCVIDNEKSISRYSRYATHSVRVDELLDERKTADAVLDVGRRLNLKGWVLFPTRDETVAAFSRYKNELSEMFRVPTPGWDCVQWAWDKRRTWQKAQELGVPSPRTWMPREEAELEQIDAPFPLVMKPSIKEHFFYETKVKAWRVNNREELHQRFREAAVFVPAGEMMIQELIPGGSERMFGYCAFFKEGKARGVMVTRYRRQHPPQFGRSCTYVETTELREIETIAERFLRGINYYGLVEMEFKHDSCTGEYKLLDVNARTWGYHSLGVAAGVDFTRKLFEDQLGRETPVERARPGVTWLRLATDLPVGVMGIIRRQWGLGAYLRSITRFNVEAVFSRDDFMPSLVEAAFIPYFFIKKGY